MGIPSIEYRFLTVRLLTGDHLRHYLGLIRRFLSLTHRTSKLSLLLPHLIDFDLAPLFDDSVNGIDQSALEVPKP